MGVYESVITDSVHNTSHATTLILYLHSAHSGVNPLEEHEPPKLTEYDFDAAVHNAEEVVHRTGQLSKLLFFCCCFQYPIFYCES